MLEHVDSRVINLWLEEEVDSIISAMLINQLNKLLKLRAISLCPPSTSGCFLSLASVSVGVCVAID